MTVELFTGNPDQLAARLTTIAGGNTINQVIPTSNRGVYIILFT